MFIRWFFKYIVVILVICAALLGYLRFDDLTHWFPSFEAEAEPSARVGTAGKHVVAVSSGVAEDQSAPEAITQRRIGRSDSNSTPDKAADGRQGRVSSQAEMESVFQRATENEETFPDPDIGSARQTDSRDEDVEVLTSSSDEAPKQPHRSESTPPTQAEISSAVTQTTVQVVGSEDADVLFPGSVSLNTPDRDLTEGVSEAQSNTTKQLTSKHTANVTDKVVGKTMMAPEISLLPASGLVGSQPERMNELGDVTRRDVETSRRRQLPPTATAADSKGLPTPLVEWIPPSTEPKEHTEEAAGTPAAQRQTVQAIWVDARTAFWNRDLAVAELKYHSLSAKLPDNPDVMGELGNVFYVQGKHKQTIEAYYRAAELLIDEGRSSRVNIILDLIYELEPEKANTLRARMARMHDNTGG